MTWPEDRVLVAAITRRRDLRLAREAGWYRIPFGRMPQGIPAEYIAFFTGARVAVTQPLRFHPASHFVRP